MADEAAILAGRECVDACRNVHATVVHGVYPPLNHEPYTQGLIANLGLIGFSGIDDFFAQSESLNLMQLSVELGVDVSTDEKLWAYYDTLNAGQKKQLLQKLHSYWR
jgi:hypothetical protein